MLGPLLPQELQRMAEPQIVDDRRPIELQHPQRIGQRFRRIGRDALSRRAPRAPCRASSPAPGRSRAVRGLRASRRRISSYRRTVMLRTPMPSSPSCGPTKVAGSGRAAGDIGWTAAETMPAVAAEEINGNLIIGGPLAPSGRLEKRPAGGPQLRKSGGPELRKSGGLQPRKLGGPQQRKSCTPLRSSRLFSAGHRIVLIVRVAS